MGATSKAAPPAGGRIRRLAAVLLTLGLGAAQLSAGSPVWQKKDWTQWSEQDCSNVLLHSPWGFQAASSTQENRYEIHDAYSAQFTSALPIRLALVRQHQVKAKYDKMSPEQRQQFDLQVQPQLDQAQYADVVLLDVYYSHYQSGPNSHRENAPAAERCTLMFPNGQVIASSLPKVIKTDDTSAEYTVTFPRTINGKPLLSATDKKLQMGCPVMQQLDVSKMMFKGKLEY